MFRRLAINRFSVLLVLSVLTTAHARTRPQYGGTLRVEVQADPWQAPDSIGRSLVFDTLTRTDAAGTVQPALAVRWASQNSNHRWQFWIRPGVHFHDGSLLTSDSVLQSLARSCAQCPWASARALADSIVFTTNSPDPVLPAELSRSIYAIAKQDGLAIPLGTGPFRLVSNENYVLSLAAVEDAWQGRPFVDTVKIYGRRVVRTQWLDLISGQADIVDVPVENIRQAQQEHLTLMQTAGCDLLVLGLSGKRALADDSQRDAIALAVDRGALYNVIFQKQAEVTASLLPNALTGYSLLFLSERDLARAQAEHTAGSGPTLTLMVEDGNTAMRLAADRIALNLLDASFRVQVINRPLGTGGSTPDLVLRKIHREAGDAESALRQMLGEFNQPLQEGNGDPSILYREESAFLQTHQAIPLLYLPRAYAVGPRIQGLRLSSGGIPLLADVSLEDVK